MKTVQFKDVAVGSKFFVNEVEYSRVQDTRISCCKTINAIATANPKDRKQLSATTEVQVND